MLEFGVTGRTGFDNTNGDESRRMSAGEPIVRGDTGDVGTAGGNPYGL